MNPVRSSLAEVHRTRASSASETSSGMKVTPFQRQVYDLVRTIPEGKTMTYQEVAKKIGKPKAFRAVGTALARNPFAPQVPCHRVIRSDGGMGGYAWGVSKKIKLLKKEGALK